MRVLEIGEGASSPQAAGTVLVDRLTGFIALFMLALAALPFAFHLLPPATAFLIALLAGGVLLGSALLFEGKILRQITACFPRALSLAGDAWLAQTYNVITACGQRAILSALLISVIFNLTQIWSTLLAAQALRRRAARAHFDQRLRRARGALRAALRAGGPDRAASHRALADVLLVRACARNPRRRDVFCGGGDGAEAEVSYLIRAAHLRSTSRVTGKLERAKRSLRGGTDKRGGGALLCTPGRLWEFPAHLPHRPPSGKPRAPRPTGYPAPASRGRRRCAARSPSAGPGNQASR